MEQPPEDLIAVESSTRRSEAVNVKCTIKYVNRHEQEKKKDTKENRTGSRGIAI